MFWYNEDIKRLKNDIEKLDYNPKLVFYGSSTFTLWNELTSIYSEYNPINLGFGGSTLAACTWFFDDIFKDIKNIESIVIYAGDNDLGDGRHPEEVLLFLENLLAKIEDKFGEIKCSVISIKPSIARKNLQGSIHFTNSKIKELLSKKQNHFYINIYDLLLDENGNPNHKYFEEDGLHFNNLGYQLVFRTLKLNSEIFPAKLVQEI
ncbi:GDSL-type esterase/lipase family protein [Polaribacter sp. Z022]|uniref:GDSL-type esterase/lipase family protein n=1 Tax=Polaribacter sp. Z022 TaxID=2927125 RepID=UPI00202109D8|nr:GDSL-type esterase/lipase family protein [Polaribacter sp. Z022]MCL7753374.1 GDSL-type esterase/lipase family protein [Polaribacter sp. Z022]